MVGPADIEHGEVQLQRGGEALWRIEIRGAETLTTSTKPIVKETTMKVLRNWFWPNLLFLLFATGLLAGCYRLLPGPNPKVETTLRGYAENFVSALDVDIVDEEHDVLLVSFFDDATPYSHITSTYVVSETSEEVKEKLRALLLSENGWLGPNKDGLIGGKPLPLPLRDRPEIDVLLMCALKQTADGEFYHIYTFVNTVILTKEGKLVIRLHERRADNNVPRCYL